MIRNPRSIVAVVHHHVDKYFASNLFIYSPLRALSLYTVLSLKPNSLCIHQIDSPLKVSPALALSRSNFSGLLRASSESYCQTIAIELSLLIRLYVRYQLNAV